ncbi:MAG: methyltransferase domain-containing protein [Anaerolineae bacterium]
MKSEEQFFDFAAEAGLTKHLGGVEATDELAHLCRIDEDSYVLDVGCGVGATPVYLVKTYGCRAMGVDIVPRMIERCEERARRERVASRTEFRVADAQHLPFDDDLFDAVITESVAAFPEDKQEAVNEFVRVTKPGGYVGLNESTWLKTSPPPDVVAWASQEVGASVSPLTRDEWVEMLEAAGLDDIVVRVRAMEMRDEAKGILRRYGVGGMLRSMWRALRMYLRNPAYRRFVTRVRQEGITPENLDEHFGYGLYVGRK